MELRKITERALRTYDENNVETEIVESVEYHVFDQTGTRIGNITCRKDSAYLNLDIKSDSIKNGLRRIASILNATIDEEGGEA